MTHQKIKYLCDYCNREYSVSANAEKHEIECYHNPARQACATCKHFVFGTEEVHNLVGGFDNESERFGWGCEIDAMPYEEGQAQPTYYCGKHELKEPTCN